MVDDAVDHGGGHLVVPEHRPPPAELQIHGDHHRLPLVYVGEDLEEQPRPGRVEREKPELDDDEQAGLADERGFPVEPPVFYALPGTDHISVVNPNAYVAHWNTKRRRAQLKGLTPEEFRSQSLAA